jgi:Mrp family chromosome partitioning ATPase
VLGRLDVLPEAASRVIVVTSAENEAPSAAVALQLAALLARDRGGRVLLVDANFDRPELSAAGGAGGAPGLLDLLAGQIGFAEAARPTKLARLSVIGRGSPELRDEAGSTRSAWETFWKAEKAGYSAMVVHAGGLLNSREAAPIAKRGDCTLLVAERKVSRREPLSQAAELLAEAGASTLGVIYCEPAGRKA